MFNLALIILLLLEVTVEGVMASVILLDSVKRRLLVTSGQTICHVALRPSKAFDC